MLLTSISLSLRRFYGTIGIMVNITENITEEKRLKKVFAVVIAYISLVVLSNLGSLRIISVAGLSLDGGTLLYPFSFVVRDMLHKKVGASLTRFTIWLSAAVCTALFAFVWLVGLLPPDLAVGPQKEYSLVLVPGLRLVAASIIAMTVSELLDTRIYSLVRRRFGSRRQLLRPLISNAVSMPVDTAIFIAIAFAGRYSWQVLLSLFVANLIIKYAVCLISFWWIYFIRDDRD